MVTVSCAPNAESRDVKLFVWKLEIVCASLDHKELKTHSDFSFLDSTYFIHHKALLPARSVEVRPSGCT